MHIAIFGANGRTGSLLTGRALAAGHTVSALVREPKKFPYAARCRVVEGSVFDPAAISATLRDTDAVFSALGAHSPFKKEDVLERAMPLITAAMEQYGPSRLIALGSAGALPNSLDKQASWRRWIVQKIVYNVFLKYPVASQIFQYAILSHSNLDWTMVMPPMLTGGPAKGHYRIDPDALPHNGSSISRSDVADFMMLQLTNSQWIKKGVYITW
ncbi:putative NADH-flavin reductase [Granulicella aggregans]|uniref:Putative NADH-flavin reductase n=1 Tax=Granulicella aggregans TaxID=474949 RepID=A0A7W7ZEM1_9BACT|nr:SDR family oxidoreductase [Granulicella aggregans]MBB5058199.1 putative NADH-flavin reductase [Granulicella aggregans]